MRKALTILAGCGLALGAAACGKHDDGNSGGNLSAADNMLVPADENAADAGLSNDADAANVGEADNSALANTSASTAPGATSAGTPAPAGSGGQ